LRAEGEEVALLVVIDAMTPDAIRLALRRWMSPRARLGRQARRGLRRGGAKLLELAGREARAAFSRVRRAAGAPPVATDEFDYEGAVALGQRYRAAGNDVPLAVFRTPPTPFTAGGESLGWAEVHRGPLACEEVPGDHLSMLQAPNV